MLVLIAANLVLGEKPMNPSENAKATDTIVVGGGCFWCVEAVFQRVNGVKKCVSGYAGGRVPNPTYDRISDGDTGHAEVVRVEFNPAEVSLDRVLDVFFAAHDPTTPNRQGNDVGTQYRSIILYANDEQKKASDAAIERAGKEWNAIIVTEIAALEKFYPAEEYHQNYFNQNANRNPYCSIVIAPKLKKLKDKGILK